MAAHALQKIGVQLLEEIILPSPSLVDSDRSRTTWEFFCFNIFLKTFAFFLKKKQKQNLRHSIMLLSATHQHESATDPHMSPPS